MPALESLSPYLTPHPDLRNNPYAEAQSNTIERDLRMAGRKVLAITERQFGVLRVLWEHGPRTVRELMEHLPRGDGQPYTTVLGLLQTMERPAWWNMKRRG